MPGDSLENAKKAYRRMVKVWHPDRFKGDPVLSDMAHEKIKEINEAYKKIISFEGCQTNVIERGNNHTQYPSSRLEKQKFKEEVFYPKEGIAKNKPIVESNQWIWCLIPVIGLPILMQLKRKSSISIGAISAKILISICFFLYATSFLVEAVILGRGVQSTLYWLIAVVYIAIKSRVVIKTSKEKVAFMTQLNVLVTVLFFFWITKGILYLV